MKTYHVLKNIETRVNYIPFFRLTASEGSRKEYTPFITNGIVTVELIPSRKSKCEEIEIDESEFWELSKELNINPIHDCKPGELFENWGFVFTLELYKLSDEYMQAHELYNKARMIGHNPIYSERYGSIDAAWIGPEMEV